MKEAGMQQSEPGSDTRIRPQLVVLLWLLAALAMLAGLWLGRFVLSVKPAAAQVGHAPVAGRYAAATRRVQPSARPYTFPAGGRTLAGAYRIVALYGAPDEPPLGVLGEQSLPATLERAKQVAAAYSGLTPQPVLPALEIIATVASASPTENGDYSREGDPALLLTWARAAAAAGEYVILDLQPGRTDFLTQAQQYERVLREPNVGLALDPEWRLAPGQVPLQQIGSVSITEVNSVADWLADLTAREHLPQKLFVLHEFRLDMLPGREQLHTTHPELACIIQMDGQGAQPVKQDTWRAVTASPPSNVQFGWKNFYDEDKPPLDPAATMQLSPQPWYVSYQ